MVTTPSRLPLIQTLPDQVYEIIKQQIIAHHLRPGQPLVEKQLAEGLGVSTTPIREALLRLEHEGFASKTPYAGARVAEISSKDARDIFQLRAVLEGLAARLAAPLFSEEDLQKATQCVIASEAALESGDHELCAMEGRRFHGLVLESVDCRVLQDHLQLLSGHVERVRNITSRVLGASAESIQGHKMVLECLRRRDAAAAEQAMKEHITWTFDHLTRETIEAAFAQLEVAEASSGRH